MLRTPLRIIAPTLLLLTAVPVLADLEPPELSGNVMLQYYHYIGEDDPDLGYSVPANKIAVRHATVGAVGELGDYLHYAVELGVSTCAGSGGDDISVKCKEAEIIFTPLEWLGVGIARGHTMRGYVGLQECFDNPTCEKPRFFSIFGQCHMTGARLELSPSFGDYGLDLQAGFYNGAANTMDIEGIALAGLQFHLPWGVSLGGHYEIQTVDYDFDGDYDDVWRASAGLRWDYQGFYLVGEYFLGSGFNASYGDLEPVDLERDAYYLQAAYDIELGSELFPYLQPHLMYEGHDLGANADDGLDRDYAWLTAGLTLGIGEGEAAFKLDYAADITSERDNEAHGADAVYVRLQVCF